MTQKVIEFCKKIIYIINEQEMSKFTMTLTRQQFHLCLFENIITFKHITRDI